MLRNFAYYSPTITLYSIIISESFAQKQTKVYPNSGKGQLFGHKLDASTNLSVGLFEPGLNFCHHTKFLYP